MPFVLSSVRGKEPHDLAGTTLSDPARVCWPGPNVGSVRVLPSLSVLLPVTVSITGPQLAGSLTSHG